MNNPYNYHLPVHDETMFFGRTWLLQRLSAGLTQPRPLSAAIFGGRRCGKTSLLRKLEGDMRSGKLLAGNRSLVSWYYDPQAGYPIASGDDFFSLILDSLRRTLCPDRISGEQIKTTYRSARHLGPVNAFERAFDLVNRQCEPGIRLVILVDEAETLLTAPWAKDLRPNLRNLLSNSSISGSLALVMSGSALFHAQVTEKDSPLENILTRYSLTNLTHEETLALAREPNQQRLSLAAAEQIWVQTGGHACLAQFILHELWYDLIENNVEALPEDVDDIASEFSEQVDHFERWSTALSPLSHDVYSWLIAQTEPLRYADFRRRFASADGGDLQRALHTLVYHGLINVTGRGRHTQFSVAGELFRTWYLNDMPDVRQTDNSAGPAGLGPALPPVSSIQITTPPACDLFDLEIEAHGSHRYEVQVLDAPTGPLRGTEAFWDLDDATFQELLARVHIGDVNGALLNQIGQQLHKWLFSPSILGAHLVSREAARARDRGLCIRLRLHQPELAALPWELLYDPQEQSFGVLSHRSPLIRFLPGITASSPPPASPPWKLLLVTASPTDLPELSVERERNAILDAINPLVETGQIRVAQLEHATPGALLAALRQGAHWLHFIGHGEYDRHSGKGALILEQQDRTGTRIDVDTLRHLLPELHQRPSAQLRLVFLNACASAQIGMTPGTRGLAQTLVQAGIPTTIGMSRPISNSSAKAFSQGFYEALAQADWSVVSAVTEGRRRVMVESGLHSGDWGVPALFMRAFGIG